MCLLPLLKDLNILLQPLTASVTFTDLGAAQFKHSVDPCWLLENFGGKYIDQGNFY